MTTLISHDALSILVCKLLAEASDEHDIHGQAAAMLTTLYNEREQFRKLEAQAAHHVEVPIIGRTHFTGEPPYVGWKGLGLALTETLDELDNLRAAKVERV